MGSTQLRARTMHLADVTAQDRRQWLALSGRALEPSPFLDPAYLHTARAWVPEVRDLQLVVVEDGSAMRALLPVRVQRRTRTIPLPHATTAGPFMIDDGPLLTPLVDRERADAALGCLLDHLGTRTCALPGLLKLPLVPGTGPFYDLLHDVVARRGVPILERWRYERAVARLDPDQDWREGLSGKRRRDLGRHARRITAQLGDIELEDCAADPRAFEELVEWEARSWKGDPDRGGEALALSPDALAWYRSMVGELRDRGQLHLLRMTAGGRTVYMSMLFRFGNRVFSLIDAYDHAVSHLRPGNVGRAAVLDHFQAGPEPILLDSCMHPVHRQSTANLPHRAALVGLLLAPRCLVNKVAVRAAPAVRALRAVPAVRALRAAPAVRALRAVRRGRDLRAATPTPPERP